MNDETRHRLLKGLKTALMRMFFMALVLAGFLAAVFAAGPIR